jgi:hypothetical protein
MREDAMSDAIPIETKLPPLRRKLAEMKQQWETGQGRLAHLDAQRQETRDTLLRIAGAIQVLQELLGETVEEPSLPRPAAG